MNTKDVKNTDAPAINAEFKNTGEGGELTISDEQFAQLSEVTNTEQIAKLRCWDIQEYIDGVEAQKAQLEAALANAQTQLEEAKSNLVQARTELKATFDTIFVGLEDKMVSVSPTSPHVVTIIDPQAQGESLPQ